MNNTSAKDFNRFHELLDQHMDRVTAAYEAARQYMQPSTLLLSKGIVMYSGILSAPNRAILAAEIRNTRPGDAKRKDSLVVDRGGASCDAMHTIEGLVLAHFRSRQSDVVDEMTRNSYLQHLAMEPGDDDIQKVLHRDTFFPALKYWYFPEEVTDGAFVYAPHSPELTEKRLAWERRMVQLVRSGQVEPWRGAGHAEGSFRVAQCEMAAMGLEAAPVPVPADTLVIANVFGFHRRGDVSAPVSRLSISGSIRFKQPFLT